MSVSELRCPSCSAPVGAPQERWTSCRYCGATLDVGAGAQGAAAGRASAGARVRREEHHVVVIEVVGPSNAARVEGVLRAAGGAGVREVGAGAGAAGAGVSAAGAGAIAGRREVDLGDDAGRARELARALGEAGASVRLEARIVEVPLPPDVAVLLDDAGPRKVAVIHAVREHLGLGIAEAKRVVESAPCTLVEVVEARRGEALLRDLTAAGARARSRIAGG
jgi:large subunit ribosomal protein L7/L12